MKIIEMNGQVRIGDYVVYNDRIYTLLGFDNGKFDIVCEYFLENKLVLPQSIRPFFLQTGDILVFYAYDSMGDLTTDEVQWTIMDIEYRDSGIFIMVEGDEDS